MKTEWVYSVDDADLSHGAGTVTLSNEGNHTFFKMDVDAESWEMGMRDWNNPSGVHVRVTTNSQVVNKPNVIYAMSATVLLVKRSADEKHCQVLLSSGGLITHLEIPAWIYRQGSSVYVVVSSV